MASLPSGDNSRGLGSGYKTQLQAEGPNVVQSPYKQDVSSTEVYQVISHGTQPKTDEPLPWETQWQDQHASVEVQYVAKQLEGRREAKTVEEDSSGEANRRGRNMLHKENERRAEEERANEEKAAQEPAVKELKSVGQLVDSADSEIVEDPSRQDSRVKERLAQDTKANKEGASCKNLADEKERVKKDMAEKLAQEQTMKEEEARRKEVTAKKEEQAAKRNARRRELAAQKKIRDAKVASELGAQPQKQADATKTQEEKVAQVRPESLVKAGSKDAEVSSRVTTGTKRTVVSPSLEAKPAKTRKLPESFGTRDRKSSTPSSARSDPDRVRSSMTPAIPGTVEKLSFSGNSSMTSRLSARTPLRSAFRQNSSISRGSVSFLDEQPDSVKLDSSPSATAARKLDGAKSARSLITTAEDSKSRAWSTQKSSESTSGDATKQLKDLPGKCVPKEKVQTTLNIKRDKKLKGRVVDPPTLSEPATQKEVVISSDSEKSVSTFYSDEEDMPRNAKAGPSSNRKLTIAEAKGSASTKRSPTSNLPADKMESPSQGTVTPSRKTIPLVVVEALTRTKSPSRSPAQYMSGANSLSSETGSESETGLDSESEIDSELGTDSGSLSGSDDKRDTLPSGGSKIVESEPSDPGAGNGDIEMGDPSSAKSVGGEAASQSSQTSSTGSQESEKPKDDDSQHLARDANQQLQRESRQSRNSSHLHKLSKTPDSQNVKGNSSGSANDSKDPDHPVCQREKSSDNPNRESFKDHSSAVLKPGFGANGMPGNILRPANQRYSSITDLMNQPKVEVKSQISGIKSAASQGTTMSVAEGSVSSSSETESASESSGEDTDDMTADGKSQISANLKHGAVKGLEGVMKRMFAYVFPS